VRIALEALPDGVGAQVEGKRAVVSYGDPEAPTVVVVATDGTDLILFPDRSYKQEDLAKALGLKS
jgi:hypothetical protein